MKIDLAGEVAKRLDTMLKMLDSAAKAQQYDAAAECSYAIAALCESLSYLADLPKSEPWSEP